MVTTGDGQGRCGIQTVESNFLRERNLAGSGFIRTNHSHQPGADGIWS